MAKYTVQSGDSWYKIAGKVYGGDQRFFNVLQAANSGVGMLQAGMVIDIPDISGYMKQLAASGQQHYVGPDDIASSILYDYQSGYDKGDLAFKESTAPSPYYQRLFDRLGITPRFTSGGYTAGGGATVQTASQGGFPGPTGPSHQGPAASGGGPAVPGGTLVQEGDSHLLTPDPSQSQAGSDFVPEGAGLGIVTKPPSQRISTGAIGVAPTSTALTRRGHLWGWKPPIKPPYVAPYLDESLYPTLGESTTFLGPGEGYRRPPRPPRPEVEPYLNEPLYPTLGQSTTFLGPEGDGTVGPAQPLNRRSPKFNVASAGSSDRRAATQRGGLRPPRIYNPSYATNRGDDYEDYLRQTNAGLPSTDAYSQRGGIATINQFNDLKPVGTYRNWTAVAQSDGTVKWVRSQNGPFYLASAFNPGSDQGAWVAQQVNGYRVIGGGDGLPDLDITAGVPGGGYSAGGGGFGNATSVGGSGGFVPRGGGGGGSYTRPTYSRAQGTPSRPPLARAAARAYQPRGGGGGIQAPPSRRFESPDRGYRALIGAISWRLF